ncbi:MAG: hypothetical protein OHK0039_21850 [Bacteroidia bacterium]
MNLLQAIYCSQYDELRARGKGDAARGNGILLATIVLVMHFFTAMFLFAMLSPAFAAAMQGALHAVFGEQMGRTAGYLIALVPLALVYPLVARVWGSQEAFGATVRAFEALPQEAQRQVSRRGLIYFFASIIVAISCMALFFAG